MNKKVFGLIALFFSALCLLAIGILFNIRDTKLNMSRNGEWEISVKVNAYDEPIHPYYNFEDDTYYFFMPSSLVEPCISVDWLSSIYIDGKRVGQFSFYEWEEGRTYMFGKGDDTVKVRFALSSDITTLFITTESGSIDEILEDKNVIERGRIEVVEPDGKVSYSGGLSIRVRGNSTYRMFEKKPFNIKLDKAASMLGMKEERDFCLLANSWDYSYMNNMLALDMASKAGIKFAPEANYADLYIDGEYYGLYLITEKIEVDENRIHITNLSEENKKANPNEILEMAKSFDFGDRRGIYLDYNPSDITGGYLLERDYRLSPDYQFRETPISYFETENYGTGLRIKEPEYASEEEVDYIRMATSEMEDAIVSEDGKASSGKYYLDIIDLDSWVKWYLIAEISYDTDKDITNTYLYKDVDNVDSKFYMGPAWDYDCRFGGTVEYPSSEVLTKLQQPDGWCQHLYEKDEFYQEICSQWENFYEPYLRLEAETKIDEWQNLIRKSVKMDNIRWNRSKEYPVLWPDYNGSTEFINEYSFDGEVEYLKRWIAERRAFLNYCWTNNTTD